MNMKTISVAVYVIGLLCSGFLSFVLLSSLSLMGWQAGPVYLKVIAIILIVLPAVGIAIKLVYPSNIGLTLAAGVAMIFIPVIYYILALAIAG